jgi:hypothetical protein
MSREGRDERAATHLFSPLIGRDHCGGTTDSGWGAARCPCQTLLGPCLGPDSYSCLLYESNYCHHLSGM